MRSNNPYLYFTFSENRNPPISSQVTQRQTTQSFIDSLQYTNKNNNNQNNRFLHPQFLSLINYHLKATQQQNHPQSEIKSPTIRQKLSFVDNLCRCVEIEKDVTHQKQKITESVRVDLRHLLQKNKKTEIKRQQKCSLTPINSLVNLLDQSK